MSRTPGSEGGPGKRTERQPRHRASVRPYTKLAGPTRGEFYDLYVIIDIYSRYVVAWTIATTEDAAIARDLISTAIIEQGIDRDQLTLHADRGSAMTSKHVVQLLIDLGVTRTHSRPKVSNDNPFSEAQFKTLKYCPAFPQKFASIGHALEFCTVFFDYYNHEHRHSSLGLHTPATVHTGEAITIRARRQQTLDAAYVANPTRFSNRQPVAPKLPTTAWINRPTPEALIQSD